MLQKYYFVSKICFSIKCPCRYQENYICIPVLKETPVEQINGENTQKDTMKFIFMAFIKICYTPSFFSCIKAIQ